jgi:hypothetical protein
MNNKFDELTKAMAQSVTRRAAFKKFGVGLAGMALGCFGLANKAAADQKACVTCHHNCLSYYTSAGYSQKQASTFCDSQCAWVCIKRPI